MEWQAEPGRHRRPGDPRGWTRSWRAALLAASIFSSSFLLAQGQLATTTDYNISISKNPQETLEGQNVNLTLQHEAANFIVCNWYRGIEMKENLIVTYYLPPITGTTNGNSYTGREVVGFGCSLLIKNLNLNDTGTYMVIMNGPSVHGKGLVNIQVLDGPDAPVISPSGQFYAESSNLTLSCQADSNPPANYTWSFKNATHSGGIYRLFRLSSANNGTYTCEASNNETKLSQSKAQPVCVLASSPSPTTLLGMLTGVLSPNDPT